MKKIERHVFSLLVMLSVLIGCGKDNILSPAAYVQWIKNTENGFNISKPIKEYEFIAQYKPLDFIVAQEEKTETLSKELLDKRKKELGEDYLYFNLRIKSIEGNLSPIGSGAHSDQEYQRRLAYFTFDMQEDLYLLHGKDTLPCTLYQFVQTYDIAPYIEFALGFKKAAKIRINQEITFVLEDRILGVGSTRMLFKKHIFEDTPKIKTL